MRQREANAAGDREESPLELGVGHGEGAAVERVAQGHYSRLAGVSIERCAEGFRVDEVELVGLG
jgi:hypothetical protein